MDIAELESKNVNDLRDIAREMEISGYTTLKKQGLILEIMRAKVKAQGHEFRGGVLEIVEDDKQSMGFLRTENYLPGPDDIYVSNSQIRRLGMRTGDMVMGQVRVPKDNEKYFSLLRVEAINGQDPENAKRRPKFKGLTPIFPLGEIKIRTGSSRLVDKNAGFSSAHWSRTKRSHCFTP